MSLSTHRVVLFAVLASMLAACGDQGTDTGSGNDAATEVAPAAEGPAEGTTAPSGDAAVAVASTPAPPRYVFGFTSVGEGEDPRVVDWVEDPCGVTAMAAVDRLPIDDPTLRPDYVVEFDATGAQTRRWAKPYSAEIVAIAGERLHFRAPHEDGVRVFWTQADGTVGVLEENLADPAAPAHEFADGAVTVECPALPDFEGSDYVQCYEITDAAGARRRVAFEGACS